MSTARLTLALSVAAFAVGCAGPAIVVKRPATTSAATGQPAAEFTERDHLGREVSLKSYLEDGRVALVFYRGHW